MTDEWDLPADEDAELSWQVDALCAQVGTEMFFPEKGGSTADAKRICADCDVRAQCLQWAMANDERFGVWGGLSDLERRKLKRGIQPKPRQQSGPKPRKPERPKRPVLRHGTETMWRRGCRTVGQCSRGEDGLSCVQAHREYRAAAAVRRRAKRDAA